jgi:hypothetical protein
MSGLLLRHVKLTQPQIVSMLQRAEASTVIQNTPIVLDNHKPPPPLDADRMRMHPRIGNREIVGYGLKGKPEYFDLIMFPCPSIRWEADTPAIAALRKKEQGDWKQLSVAEKKQCKFSRRNFFGKTFLFSISRKFSSNIRRIYSTIGYLEICIWMDVNFISRFNNSL